jgi:hypothetical protein
LQGWGGAACRFALYFPYQAARRYIRAQHPPLALAEGAFLL